MTMASGQPNGLESPGTPVGAVPVEGATTSEIDTAPLIVELPTSTPVKPPVVGNTPPRTPREVSVTIPGLSQTLQGIDHEIQLLSRTHKF